MNTNIYLLISILSCGGVYGRPTSKTEDATFYEENQFEDYDWTDKEFEKQLIMEEHEQLKQLLVYALQMIEIEEDITLSDITSSSKQPLYNDRKRSNNHNDVIIPKRHRRRHGKRSAFDPIAHRSGFNGFRVKQHQKLEFSFKNLLPFLIKLKEKKT